jgi:peptidoglycan/xylan/chitin deacetylase (PgdA/CDA1 family)
MSAVPIPVLVYHSVRATPSAGMERWTVTPDAFAAHLDAVAASGRVALTVEELARGLRGEMHLPPRAVALTFDDGFADNADALAVLLDRSLRATLYVTTGYVGGEDMLSAAGVRELAGIEGLQLGAHSVSHPRLDELSATEVAEEVRASRAALEDMTGRAITSFAYPHGNHHRGVRAAVVDAGFTSAAAVKNAFSHPADDPFAIARWIVEAGTPLERVEQVLDGRVLPMAWARERMRTRGFRAVRRARRIARTITTRPSRTTAQPS